MNVSRNLNGVKRPLSDRAYGIVVPRAEERFSHAIFVPAAVVEAEQEFTHVLGECRCQACVNKMLDDVLGRSEAAKNALEASLNEKTA
jgi:hypothetical protein